MTETTTETTTDHDPAMTKRVTDLSPGDLVDLEGDPYAICPDDECNCMVNAEYEYGVVDFVELEPDDVVAVYFDNFGAIGFPPEHVVRLGDNDPRA